MITSSISASSRIEQTLKRSKTARGREFLDDKIFREIIKSTADES